MIGWSSWKRFPDAQRGGLVEAPIGPGLYEVRRELTGELVAFGHAASVAQALASLRPGARARPWRALFGRPSAQAEGLEYRVFAARSLAAAKGMADGMRRRRHVYWTWRLAGRHAA